MSHQSRQTAFAMDDFTYEELLSSEEFKTLRKLTKQETVTFSPDDALREIHKQFIADVVRVKGGGYHVPYNVAESITEIASRTDSVDQGRLVDFTARLYRQAEIDTDSGAPFKDNDGKPLWTENDCLIFSVNRSYRDELGPWDRSPAFVYTRSHDAEMPPVRKERWVNLVAFLAQLTHGAPKEIEWGRNPIDFTHIAFYSLRAAFEADIQPHELVGTTTLQAACMWFFYAADAVWGCCKKSLRFDGMLSGEQAGSQYRDRNWEGFSEERWNVWVDSLEQAQARCEESDGDARTMIQDALRKAKAACGRN